MAGGGVTRKLAAILYADVAGYSRLTGADEEGTHQTLSAHLDAITAFIEDHGGRVLHYAGDAILAEFASVVVAVACAVEVQRDLAARNEDVADDRKLQFRIGINLGDVIVDRDELYGDGVNVAARLESLADAGGICISATVYEQVRDKVDAGFQFMGRSKVKNVAEPISHYRVLIDGSDQPRLRRAGGRRPVGWAKFAVRGVLVAAAFGLGAWIWLAATAQAPRPEGPPSLTVLPFRTIGGGPEQEVFSEGLTEDLITALSSDLGFRVVAGAKPGDGKGAPNNGRPAKTRYVFEGSVRGSKRLRITAHLIDSRTGFNLWGGRYDRTLTDSLALQA